MTRSTELRIALVQLRTGRDVARNMAETEALVREAAGKGARYVQTPENTTIMELDRERLFRSAHAQERNPEAARFSALAKTLGLWLHIGSMPVQTGAGKLANRSLLFAPDGSLAARYDKIHMFDVDLAGGESFRESRNFAPGSEAVVADLPEARLGLTVCYDLRFPALYRTLTQAGAGLLAIPSAFTRQTGEAHWHVLMRARAIECGAFVLAAAQGGKHENGRETFGHSLVISPWGEVLAEAGIEPGVLAADLDLTLVTQARGRIPALSHDRPFRLPAEAKEPGLKEAS